MNRRDAIGALLALGAAARPVMARAQAPEAGRVRSIGYLSLEPEPAPRPTPEQWRQRSISAGLRRLGWDEGRDFIIARAYAGLDVARLAEHAKTLARKRVEVILASGPEATLAAARASKTIPVVALNMVWPEEQGLIKSYARPGGNVTGVSFYAGVETSTKRIELLREIAPAARRLSWLWPPDYEQTVAGGGFDMAPAFVAVARTLGFELRLHPVRSAADVNTALAAALVWGADAISASGEHAVSARQRIADFALRHRLPGVFAAQEIVEAGGLLSYSVSRAEQVALVEHALGQVDRILRGARPHELPVERPKRFELAINRKTARALGLEVPPSMLVRADVLIDV